MIIFWNQVKYNEQCEMEMLRDIRFICGIKSLYLAHYGIAPLKMLRDIRFICGIKNLYLAHYGIAPLKMNSNEEASLLVCLDSLRVQCALYPSSVAAK